MMQALWIVLICAGVTFALRAMPFLFFGGKDGVPGKIASLGKLLPPAIMAALVVYCLKGVSWLAVPHGLPELISIAAVAALHRWKGNVLLSIAGGTVLYMVLVQAVFV